MSERMSYHITTRRHKAEDLYLNPHRRESLISRTVTINY